MLRFLRKCCHCKAHTLNKTILCDRCWERIRIESRLSSGLYETNDFKTLSLFNHHEGLTKDLIVCMKGGGVVDTYKQLSQMLVANAQIYGALPRKIENTVLVPMPSSRFTSQKNHAYCLAQQIGSILHLEVKDILTIDNGNQIIDSENQSKNLKHKEKSKLARSRRTMVLNEKISKQIKNYIFIDDVVTTGSTFAAAKAAVLKHFHLEFNESRKLPNFYFWALSRTPKHNP